MGENISTSNGEPEHQRLAYSVRETAESTGGQREIDSAADCAAVATSLQSPAPSAHSRERKLSAILEGNL